MRNHFMKAIYRIAIGSLFLTALTLPGYGDDPGRGRKPSEGGDDKEGCTKGNPFDPYTGNVHRSIKDLEIWGGVGEHQLAWMRYGNSREGTPYNPQNFFGEAHHWNHSYKFDMIDVETTDGVPRIAIHYPEGGEDVFVQKSP